MANIFAQRMKEWIESRRLSMGEIDISFHYPRFLDGRWCGFDVGWDWHFKVYPVSKWRDETGWALDLGPISLEYK